MVLFRTIRVQPSPLVTEDRWAVERDEPDGLPITVSRYYATRYEAQLETETLNRQVAIRTMG
jgi:hypothetical protein